MSAPLSPLLPPSLIFPWLLLGTTLLLLPPPWVVEDLPGLSSAQLRDFRAARGSSLAAAAAIALPREPPLADDLEPLDDYLHASPHHDASHGSPFLVTMGWQCFLSDLSWLGLLLQCHHT